MEMEYKKEDKLLTLTITEEIDHHTTEKIKRRADYEIQRLLPRKVIFDFSSVSFMDSAGIGMIVGRYKLLSALGSQLELINVKPNVERVLDMSGILKAIPILKV